MRKKRRRGGRPRPAPAGGETKVLHLIRHGQGFHNLLADLYSSSGRAWTQFEPGEDNPYTQEVSPAGSAPAVRSPARA